MIFDKHFFAVAVLSLVSLAFSCATHAQNEDLKLSIVSDTVASPVADLLAAELTGRYGLVLLERINLNDLKNELGLQNMQRNAAVNSKTALQAIEGADVVLFLDEIENSVFARLVSSKSGALLFVNNISGEVDEIAKNLGKDLKISLDKINDVREGRVVEISLTGFVPSIVTAETRNLEIQLNQAITRKLTLSPGIQLLERRRLGFVGLEKSLNGKAEGDFSTGGIWVGGKFNIRNGEIEVETTLRTPNAQREEETFVVNGKAEEMPKLLESIQSKIVQYAGAKTAIQKKLSPKDLDAEIERFIKLSDWALWFEEYDLSLSAAETALHLSNYKNRNALGRVIRGESLRAFPTITGLRKRRFRSSAFPSLGSAHTNVSRNEAVIKGPGAAGQVEQAILTQQLLNDYLGQIAHPDTSKEESWTHPLFLGTKVIESALPVLRGTETTETIQPALSNSLRALVRKNIQTLTQHYPPGLYREDADFGFYEMAVKGASRWGESPEEGLEFFSRWLDEVAGDPSMRNTFKQVISLAQLIPLPMRDPTQEDEARQLWKNYVNSLITSNDVQKEIEGFRIIGIMAGGEQLLRDAVVAPEGPIITTSAPAFAAFLEKRKDVLKRNAWQDAANGLPLIDSYGLRRYVSNLGGSEFPQEIRDQLAPHLIEILKSDESSHRGSVVNFVPTSKSRVVSTPWKADDAEKLNAAVKKYLDSPWANNKISVLKLSANSPAGLESDMRFWESAFLDFTKKDAVRWIDLYKASYDQGIRKQVAALNVKELWSPRFFANGETRQYSKYQRKKQVIAPRLMAPRIMVRVDESYVISGAPDMFYIVSPNDLSGTQYKVNSPELPDLENPKITKSATSVAAGNGMVASVFGSYVTAFYPETKRFEIVELPTNTYFAAINKGKVYLSFGTFQNGNMANTGMVVWNPDTGEITPLASPRDFTKETNPVGQFITPPMFIADRPVSLRFKFPRNIVSYALQPDNKTWEVGPRFEVISGGVGMTFKGFAPSKFGGFQILEARAGTAKEDLIFQARFLTPHRINEVDDIKIAIKKWSTKPSNFPSNWRMAYARDERGFWGLRTVIPTRKEEGKPLDRTKMSLFFLPMNNDPVVEIPLEFETTDIEFLPGRVKLDTSNGVTAPRPEFLVPLDGGIAIPHQPSSSVFWHIPNRELQKFGISR